MSLFVDTSAILAFLDRRALRNAPVVDAWNAALEEGRSLHATNYVVVETHALVQARLGMDAVRALTTTLLPALEVHWIDAEIHAAAESALLTAGRRGLSLVDCCSFEVMRRLGLREALTLDADFTAQGFAVRP